MHEFESVMETWWPVALAVVAAIVWLVRLEARVNAADAARAEDLREEESWREGHEAKSTEIMRRLDGTLGELRAGQERIWDRVELAARENTAAHEKIGERMTRMETVLNGHMKPWDGSERRKERR